MKNIILSIIIPSYKETEKDIFPLLTSINNQLGVNLEEIEILIVRDGTDFLDLKFLSSICTVSIKQFLLKENVGPGLARQVGLDQAQGKFIMFCDADDILHNVGILEIMLNEIINKNLDILKTSWLEEIISSSNQKEYLTHELENTWLHGKMFRKQFLNENNISFHKDLRVHEDSYFLGIACECTQKISYLNITSYVWKYDKNSITRRNEGLYRYSSSKEFIKACSLIHEFTQQHCPEHLQYKIVQFTLYNYFLMHGPDWYSEKYNKYRIEAEEYLAETLKPFWSYWLSAPMSFIVKIYNEERKKNALNYIEQESLNNWLSRLSLEP